MKECVNNNLKSEYVMKRVNRMLVMAGMVASMLIGVSNGMAQQGGGQGGPGNFDPAQMRERMMERYKEQLEVKDDAEWKLISERVTKVTEARMAVGMGGRGMFGAPRNRGGGGANAGGDQANNNANRRQRFGGEPDPDQEALQKAIEGKASNDELKAKMAKYRESKKAKQAKLVAAQDELRKVLNVRQEAIGVDMGLLE
jgi:hypothetical protein